MLKLLLFWTSVTNLKKYVGLLILLKSPEYVHQKVLNLIYELSYHG